LRRRSYNILNHSKSRKIEKNLPKCSVIGKLLMMGWFTQAFPLLSHIVVPYPCAQKPYYCSTSVVHYLIILVQQHSDSCMGNGNLDRKVCNGRVSWCAIKCAMNCAITVNGKCWSQIMLICCKSQSFTSVSYVHIVKIEFCDQDSMGAVYQI
jgi:hypothetical protein